MPPDRYHKPSGRRLLAFYAAMVVVTFAVIEGLAFAAGKWSMGHGNPLLLYSPEIFERLPAEFIAKEATAPPLGWPDSLEPRPTPRQFERACVAAFGDSHTQAAEVDDVAAWPYLLSEMMGCEVTNYGVGGYGLDQAILRYEAVSPKARIFILGIFQEMLTRSVSPSWTFYYGSPLRHWRTKPYFIYKSGELDLISRPQDLSPVSFEDHHRHDFFANHPWTVSFPVKRTLQK